MRLTATSLAMTGFALPLAGAPLASAQNTAKPPPSPAPVHPAPAPVHKAPVVRRTVVHKTVVNEHVTEHVNEHVNERVVEPGHAPIVARGPVYAGGPGHWRSGDRFVGERRVFNDWGRYHLRAPPPGYQWEQDGDELVLISLATGIIGDTFVITVP